MPPAVTLVALIAIFLVVATSASFINFGAFTVFPLVNAAVVFHYVRQRRAGQQLNLVSYVVVLALITRAFKASPPEMTATEKATVEAVA